MNSFNCQNQKKSFVSRWQLMILSLLLLNNICLGQISFLGLDGGLEGTATVDNNQVDSSAQANKWTINNDIISLTKESDNVNFIRSGSHSLKVRNTTTTGRRVWTPLISNSAITNRTTIQLYRLITDNSYFQLSKLEQGDGTTDNESSSSSYGPTTQIPNKWEKVTYSKSSWLFTDIAGVIWVKANNKDATDYLYIDDVCIYTGGEDNNPPDAPTNATINSSGNSVSVSWEAPATGTDGGGYLVVRGTSDPTTAPNVNGIYATGNLIGSGTVVYQGSETSFNDNNLSPSTKYFYRIYTFDKAYNYSTALSGNATTAPVITDYFRTKMSGTWNSTACWESSADNIHWVASSVFPTNTAQQVTITTGNIIEVSENATSGTLTIEPGADLTIDANQNFDISGDLSIKSDNSGTGLFLPLGNYSVSGSQTVEQHLLKDRNWYVSSPVNNGLLPYNGYEYVESESAWNPLSSGSLMSQGKGYVITPTTDGVVTFNGEIYKNEPTLVLSRTTGRAKEGFNLVGNPYTAYLNWNTLSKQNLSGTMWYRSTEGHSYKFFTYNGTSAAYGDEGIGTPVGVTNLIPPMQAFWVRVEGAASGSIGFKLTDSAHRDATENKLKMSRQTIRSIIRIEVSNGVNSDETVLYTNDNASNDFDIFDSPKMLNSHPDVPDIYTMADNEILAINGMNSLPTDTEIPLGFTPGKATDFTIRTSETTHLPENIRVMLLDKDLNNSIDLTTGQSYTFSSDGTPTNERFNLILKTVNMNTEANSPSAIENDAIYGNNNKEIIIILNEPVQANAKAIIYSFSGQELTDIPLSSTTTRINLFQNPATCLVRIINGFHQSIKKLIAD